MIKEEQIFKPTLKKPKSVQSKNFEKNFSNSIIKNAPDVKLNETESTLSEAEQSLKKKIFSLSKMEALVHDDPKLSAVYDEMSVNGEEKYGYHYNETIMNMIFNDYVLNSPKYLQKYKMAIPIQKKRRDRSGINQLKKAGEEKMEKTNPEFKPKKLEPSGLPQQEKKPEVETEQTATESTGAGSSGAFAPALGYQKKSFKEGEKEINQPEDDDCFIESNGFKYSVGCDGKFQGEFVEMEDALNKVKEWKTKNNWFPNTWFISDHGNYSLIDDEGNILKEATTAGSAGGAAGYVGYAGPAAWGSGDLMKKGKSNPMLRKPIWHGGTVIQENKTNYLVDPSGFEKYFNKLNEADISYQRELGKEYQQSHTKSNNGLGVSEVPQTPERDTLKKDIDDNTALFIGQDVDKMRDDDVKILHNDMTQKHSMFPHPDNLNLQDDGISGINQKGKEISKPFTNFQKAKEDNVIIDKTSAFTSDTVKNWNKNDTNVEMDTLKTGEPDKPNLSVVEQISGDKIRTQEELKAFTTQKKATTGKGLGREDVPKLANEALYAIAVAMADKMLPMGWDGLADVNSMWDYIKKDGNMSFEQLKAAVKRAVNVRLKEEGYSLKDLGLGENMSLPEPVIGSQEFNEGDKVFDKEHNSYGTVLDNYGNPTEGDRGDIRLDSDGNVSIYQYDKDWNKSGYNLIKVDKELDEVSKSKKQQRFMGMVHAVQKGELSPNKVGGDVAKAAETMTKKDAEDFASTKHKGLPEKVKADEGVFSQSLQGFSPMGYIINYLKQKYPKEISFEKEKDIVNGSEDFVGTQLRDASPRKLISFAEDIYKSRFNKNKNKFNEETQTMIQSNGTSISNKATATGDQSGNVEMGARSTGGGGMTEAKNIFDSDNKLLEELNNELDAYSIHNDKLKKMAEDKKPSALVLRDRLGSENEKNFKSDLQDSGTKKIIDVEKELQWKDQQTDVGKDPQKLGQDLENKELKVTDDGQALKDVGDSANDEGDEVPKRNMTTKEQHDVDMFRLGQQDLVYDNEPGKRFEDRMKKDMGDKLYKQRQEKLKFRGKAPMYNKDPQPVEDTTAKKVQFDKEQTGWNERDGIGESMITGRYVNGLGKSHIVDFQLNEVKTVKDAKEVENLFELSFTGFGNKYENKSQNKKVVVNETVESVLSGNKYYTNGKDIFAVKNPVRKLNESEQKTEKPVINEQMNKMKYLLGYEPKNFIDTKGTKKNRGF
jgi:hypothetical protein